MVLRATPEPGSNEILVEAKSIAINPVDYSQRDMGLPPIPSYPAVVGSDVAGVVVKVGTNVRANAPKPGSRVIAFASAFYNGGSQDHGAFQKFVLSRSECVLPLPDNISFDNGAILPLAVLTALSSWTSIGISLDTKHSPQDKQAVLIWGGASSVGTIAIQSAKLMGFTVYTTASPRNHAYLQQELGANRVFDYGTSHVVSQITDAVRKDGVHLNTACCVVRGALQSVLDVLKVTKGSGTAKVAHAPVLLPDAPALEGVEVIFVMPPIDASARSAHIYKCFNVWLLQGLASGAVIPSPQVQIAAGGLEGLNKALDTLKAGVSGSKIVVNV